MKPLIQSTMTKQEIQNVHESSLVILRDVGIQIDHPQARSILYDAGATVDNEGRVKFPQSLVETCISQAPKSICFAGRDPEFDLELTYESPFRLRCATGLSSILEHHSESCRNATTNDQRTLAILADALANISMTAPLTLHDVPSKTADLHATCILLKSQRKHFTNLTMGPQNMRYQIEMQLAIRGSREEVMKRPLFHPISCLISPLYIPQNDIDIIMIAGEYGLPIKIPIMPMMGASSPVTLAGMLTLGNAEVLGSLCVLQTLCPGTPTVYYLVPALMDMRSGCSVYGGPENSLLYVGVIQMAHFYKIPSDTTALICDGILLEQAMHQKGCNLQLSALAGANIIAGAGTVDGAMTFSPRQLVIDDELADITKKLMRGFQGFDLSGVLDCIRRVGPKGNFLEDTHTLENFRDQAQFSPTIFSYQNFSTWQQNPLYITDRADKKAGLILDNHLVPPLENHVIKELDRIVKFADIEIAGL